MGCLYSIEFPNGKLYIGITSKTAHVRFLEHAEKTQSGSHVPVRRAIQKYGRENCVLTTLVWSDDWRKLCSLEKEYIAHFETQISGYNLTSGGDGSTGLKWNEEQRARRSEQLRGNRRAVGCVHTEEGKKRMVTSLLGNKRAVGNRASFEGAISKSSSRAFEWAVKKNRPFSHYDARSILKCEGQG